MKARLLVVTLFASGLLCLGFSPFARKEAAKVPFRRIVIDSAAYGDCKALGDINGDGWTDVIVAGGRPDSHLLWYAGPDWKKTEIAAGNDEFTTDMQMADVDGDGDLDAIVPQGRGEIGWFENPLPRGTPGKDRWKRHAIGEQGDYVHDVQAGYLLGGRALYVCTRVKDGPTALWQGNAPDKWTKRVVETAPAGEGTLLADINKDGRLDIVENGCWLECPKDPMREPWNRHTVATDWPPLLKIAAGDINGDGRLDLVMAASEDEGRLSWFEAPADLQKGAWKEHRIAPKVAYVHSLQIADVNEDGRLDILFAEMAQSASKRVGFFVNGGRGETWTLQTLATTGSHNMVMGRLGLKRPLVLLGCNWQGPPLEMWMIER